MYMIFSYRTKFVEFNNVIILWKLERKNHYIT